MKAFAVLMGSSLLAIASAAQAEAVNKVEAEIAADQTAGPSVQQTSGGQRSPDAAAGQANVGDIIVTANRREERLQRVPIAVTVADGDQLTRQNVNTVENLTRAAPALRLAGPSGYGAYSIRGFGSLSFAQSSEGSVGVVFDGVSLANTSSFPPLLFDVARVEVLEGPQSTLFGRNASAGVINIVTNAPNPTREEGYAHVDIGSRNNYIARLAANVPISSTAALRIAAGFAQDPQIQRNLADDSYQKRETKAVRGRFLWEPTSDLTINLAGDYTQTGYDGGVQWAVFSSTAGSLLTRRLAACGVTVDADNQDGCTNGGNRSNRKIFGFSGQADLDLGGVTLTSISAIRRVVADELVDIDSTTANRYLQPQQASIRNLSQELRLTLPTGGFVEGVAGLYYLKANARNDLTQVGQILADLPLINACPLPVAALCGLTFGQSRRVTSENESYAAFGQATLNLTREFRIVLGARVGHEDVTALNGASTTAPGAFAQITPVGAISANTKDTYFSYRVGAQYDLTPQLMVFATYTQGYKGPAINDQAAGVNNSRLVVEPEIPRSAEAGFKSTFAGGRLAFNATGFYTRVTNFQAQFVDTSTPANLYVFGNAPTYKIYGGTANLFGSPFAGLTFNVGATFYVNRYGEGYFQPDATGTNVDVSIDQPGGRWKLTASGEYSTALSNQFDGFIQADVVYNNRQFGNAAADRILSIDPAAIVGGRIGVRTSDGNYGLSVFARNLFDTFRPTARFVTPTAAQQLDRRSYSQFSGPEANRVIGLSLDARF